MLTTTIAAAAGEPSRGWGGPIALAVVAAVYVAGATLHDAWMRRRDLPSPTEEDPADRGVNTQVSSGVSVSDTGWWGRIVERGGRRVRVDEQPPRDAELDIDLDDDGPAETLEEAVARMDQAGMAYAEIVRRVMAGYGVSESTAKRRIRRSRATA